MKLIYNFIVKITTKHFYLVSELCLLDCSPRVPVGGRVNQKVPKFESGVNSVVIHQVQNNIDMTINFYTEIKGYKRYSIQCLHKPNKMQYFNS